MKRFLFSVVSFFMAVLGLYANPLWEGAEYLALGYMSSDTSQKALMYFDGSGNQLGYVMLNTSAYAGANSIAYGVGIVPNIDGADGLMLLRSANDFENTNNYITVNLYSDPISADISNGAELDRTPPIYYTSLGLASNSSSTFVDVVKQIDKTQSGLVTLLVDRYDRTSQALLNTYIYKYSIPNTVSDGTTITRVETPEQGPRWDIGGSDMTLINFTSGIFTDVQIEGQPNQFAVLDSTGYIRIYTGADASAANTGIKSFSVVQEGKEIVSIWGDDNYTLSVLYSDNSVLEYDSRTGELTGGSYSMNTDYTILDVVKVGSIVVPEPAQYALAFGVFAILFAVWRKRR